MKRQMLLVSALWVSVSALAAPLGGKALFQENCAACHGATGQGGSAPKLVGDASKWSAKLFERAVLTGVDDAGKKLEAPMPHWQNGSFQSDQGKAPTSKEVTAIYRYLHAMK